MITKTVKMPLEHYILFYSLTVCDGKGSDGQEDDPPTRGFCPMGTLLGWLLGLLRTNHVPLIRSCKLFVLKEVYSHCTFSPTCYSGRQISESQV